MFEYALRHTTGQDLAKMLWLKSADAEMWLEKMETTMDAIGLEANVGSYDSVINACANAGKPEKAEAYRPSWSATITACRTCHCR